MSTDEILDRTQDGLEIYQYYLGSFLAGKVLKLGQSYLSPLRTEKHPSFNLFRSTKPNCTGRIWWSDQASESGDAFRFVMRLLHCDFKTAIECIRRDVLNLPAQPDAIERLGTRWLPPLLTRPPAPVYTKVVTPYVREHDFYQGAFEQLDEVYYPQHLFGRELLHSFRCAPLKAYRYQNPDPADPKDFYVSARWPKDSMYGYRFGGQEDARYKIVRPQADKARKWISTSKRELDIFGLNRLPALPGQKLPAAVLLAGNRDTMAFARLTGLFAVAMTAEGHLPDEQQVAHLHTLAERWYVLYDVDLNQDQTGQTFQAVLTDDYESPAYGAWLKKHPEKQGYRYGFSGGLDQLLYHYQVNDVVDLLKKAPRYEHSRLATWFRQAVGLF